MPFATSSPLAEVLLFLVAYLIGGIPFGWILARVLKGVDLRTVGSGAVGATNASRQWQGGQALVAFFGVFGLDFAKGMFVALFATRLMEMLGGSPSAESAGYTLEVIAGMGAVVGHVLTPYLKFKGGKGVATSFGVVSALAPLSFFIGLAGSLLVIAFTRYMSMGALAGVSIITLHYAINHGSETFESRIWVFGFLVLMATIVFWAHRSNIKRVLAGTERRVGRAGNKQ